MYPAFSGETELIRELFGNRADSVMFYDAEQSADGYELAVARDRQGTVVDQIGVSDSRWIHHRDGLSMADIARDRGDGVKFCLTLS